MRLSPEEELFLRYWIHDEGHYEEGPGPAKRLQVEHGVRPADLAVLIAAAMPNLADQETAGFGPPPAETPLWPWHGEEFQARLAAAKAILAEYRHTLEVKDIDYHGA